MLTRRNLKPHGWTIRLLVVTVIASSCSPVLAKLWTPAQTNTVAWYDAADASTIHTNDAVGRVSRWDDKSGNGKHVTQGTAIKQPTTGAQTIGGLNSIFFEQSAGEYLFSSTFSALNGSKNRTMFLVVDANNGGAKYGFFGLASSTAGGARWTISKYYVDVVGGREKYYSPVPDPKTTLLMSALDGSTMGAAQMWANGVELTGWGLVDRGVNTASGLYIGKAAYGDAEIDSSIGEVILFDSYLSTEDRQLVEGYLAHKWGIESNLPSDHPYREQPPGWVPPGMVLIIE